MYATLKNLLAKVPLINLIPGVKPKTVANIVSTLQKQVDHLATVHYASSAAASAAQAAAASHAAEADRANNVRQKIGALIS